MNKTKDDKENSTTEVLGEVADTGLDILDGLDSVGDVLSGIGEIIGSLLS
jgi:hypothetical protein